MSQIAQLAARRHTDYLRPMQTERLPVIILVRPQMGENIGAAARAMRTLDDAIALRAALRAEHARRLTVVGAGFIGSHLADALLAAGHRVRVLDDFSTGTPANLDPRCDVLRGDVADAAAVRRAMHGVAGCFHLAAIASVGEVA